jgi:MYXO-CTERM domain-containing protein
MDICSGCGRHVRPSHQACPFCDAGRDARSWRRPAAAAVALALTGAWPLPALAADDASAVDTGRDAGSDAESENDRIVRERDEEAQRHIHPLYGVPSPPRDGCHCASDAGRSPADVLPVALAAVAVLSRRRRRAP